MRPGVCEVFSLGFFGCSETTDFTDVMPICAARESSQRAPWSPRLFTSFWMSEMERTASLPFSMSAAPEVRDAFSAEALSAAVRLISKYTDVPTDFPDATLVWIAETSGPDGILTLERCGFSSFRLGRNRRLLSGRCLRNRSRW